MGKPTARVPGRLFSLTMATTVALIPTGCSEEKKPSPAERSTSRSAHPSPSQTSPSQNSDQAEHIEGETASRAPKPVNDGQVLLSTASRKGNAEIPLTKEIGAGMLAIQVNCQGNGTVEVAVEPVGLSFPLKCVDEEVSSAYNEVHLKRARSQGTVRVTAPSTVRWALTAEQ